jgi:hypothetical protein
MYEDHHGQAIAAGVLATKEMPSTANITGASESSNISGTL